MNVYREGNQFPEEEFETWDCISPQIPISKNNKIIRKVTVLCAKGHPQWVVEYDDLIQDCLYIEFREGWTAIAFAPTGKSYEYDYQKRKWDERAYFQNSQQKYCSVLEE